jgi:hypothetical protein
MSAQVLDLGSAVVSTLTRNDERTMEVTEAKCNVVRRIHRETLYQMYFADEPTREQLAREQFLLECD